MTKRKPQRPRLEVRRDSEVWGSFDWNDDLVLFDHRVVKRKRDVTRKGAGK